MSKPSEIEKKIRAEITPTIKVLNESEGLVEYVASDESLDSGREVILASGWTFNRLAKNPAFVDSHNYWSIGASLGRLVSWRIDAAKRQLIEVAKWAIDVEANDVARLGFQMTVKGYLRACSIGAMITKQLWRDDDGFAEALSGTTLSDDEKHQVRRVIVGQDQYELSACVIGANPSALARALEAGDVSEGLMARCGFDSDDKLEVLKVASEIFTAPGMDAVTKEAARINVIALMRTPAARRSAAPSTPLSTPPGTPGTPAASAHTRSAADASEGRAREQREEWKRQALAQLKAL